MRDDTVGSYGFEQDNNAPNRRQRRVLAKKSGKKGFLKRWLSMGAAALGLGASMFSGKAAYANLFSSFSLNEPLPKLHLQEQELELMFLDPQVQGFEKLAAGARPGVASIMLDPGRDGMEQITETLLRVGKVKAVHIIAHGQSGALQLGSTWLTQNNLDSYAAWMKQWFRAGNRPDIMIYGCNVAEGLEGAKFIRKISDLAGADVAASVDVTGSPAMGMDWELEASIGQVDAQPALLTETQQAFEGNLLTFYVDSISDGYDATPGDGFCDTGAPYYVCTLRAALEEANFYYSQDIIRFDATTFASPETLYAYYGPMPIASRVVIDGYSAPAQVTVDGMDFNHIFNITEYPLFGGIYTRAYIGGLDLYDGYNYGSGGNIYMSYANLAGDYNALFLQGVNIESGWAYYYGGGLAAFGSYVSMDNTNVFDNYAYKYGGGGVYMAGFNYYYNELYVTNSNISYNISYYERGGGIKLYGGNAYIYNTGIGFNYAFGDGGGILAADGSTVDFVNSWAYFNYAVGDGGGIAASNYSYLNMDGSGLYANFATSDGGGASVDGDSSAYVYGSYAAYGYAGDSGGGFYFESYYANYPSRIVYTAVEGNYAYNTGGGIYAYALDYLSLEEAYVAYNYSYYAGGGVYALSTDVYLQQDKYDTVVAYNALYSSSSFGGGVLAALGDVFVEDYTVVGYNYAVYGGGVASFSDPAYPSSVYATDYSYISGNFAFVGGGILSVDSNVYVDTYSWVNYNIAVYAGGGVYNYGDGAVSVTDDGSVFNNGFFYAYSYSNPYLYYYTGQGLPFVGGGIFNATSDTYIGNGGTVWGNYATYGGGVFSGGGDVNLDYGAVFQNYAGGYYTYGYSDLNGFEFKYATSFGIGGGIYAYDANVNLDYYSFVGYNFSFGDAGGIYSVDGAGDPTVATVTADLSAVVFNRAYGLQGYAYYKYDNYGGVYALSYFGAYGAGGGIFNYDGNVTLQNAAVVDYNSAFFGAGVYSADDDATVAQATVDVTDSYVNYNYGTFTKYSYLNGYGLCVQCRDAGTEGLNYTYYDYSYSIAYYQGLGGGIYNLDGLVNLNAGTYASQVNGNFIAVGAGILSYDSVYGTATATVMADSASIDYNLGVGYSVTFDGTYYYDGYSFAYYNGKYQIAYDGRGGGVYNAGGVLDISNGTSVYGNFSGRGGGILNTSFYGGNMASATVADAVVAYNTAYPISYSFGYRYYSYAGGNYTYAYDSFVLSTLGGAGGGAYNYASDFDVQNSAFDGNVSGRGGGVYNYDYYGVGTQSIASSSVGYNYAIGFYYADLYPFLFNVGYYGYGAGVFNAYAYLPITDSTVDGNYTTRAGGGILNLDGEVYVSGASSVSYNAAASYYYYNLLGIAKYGYPGSGGGAANFGGVVTLDGTVANFNGAYEAGGGIYNASGLTYAQNGADVSYNGYVYGSYIPVYFGGGAYNIFGAVVVDNSTMTYNTAFYTGGGISSFIGQNVGLTATIDGNYAYLGGGIYAFGGYPSYGLYTFLDASSVDYNSAYYGGGVLNRGYEYNYYGYTYSYEAVLYAFPGTTINNNYAYVAGGGVWNDGAYGESIAVLYGAEANYNYVYLAVGGGVANTDFGAYTVALYGSMNYNSAVVGGGLFSGSGAAAAFKYANANGNYVLYYGGGVANAGNSDFYAYASYVAYNYATYAGAGIFNDDSEVQAVYSYILANNGGAGSEGGGVYSNDGQLIFANDIVAYNYADVGGGVFARGTATYMYQNYVAYNTAANYGGGFRNGSGSIALVLDSLFAANYAYSAAGIWNAGNATVLDSDVAYNVANYSGGGVQVGGGTFRFRTGSMYGNTAGAGGYYGDGGALYVSGGTANVNESVFYGNYAFNGAGAAQISGTLNAWDSTFADNYASVQGGGFATAATAVRGTPAPGTATFDRSTFSGNVAASDGGGVAVGQYASTVNLQNVTVSGNETSASGGGVFASDGNLSLLHVTVTNNTAATVGGGVASGMLSGAPTIARSIVGDNIAASNADLDSGAGATAFATEYTLVGSVGTAVLNETTPGSNLLDVAPRLWPLDFFGGPTQTHMLLMDSPALDAIAVAAALPIDQRGVVRPQDFGWDGTLYSDMGAVEGQIEPTPTPTATPTATPTPTETILCARADGCFNFELLSVDYPTDAGARMRWRLTNTCSSDLTRVDFRFVPGAFVGDLEDGVIYTSTGGRNYVADVVSGPHAGVGFTPQAGTPLSPGQSDEFEFIVQTADLSADTVLWNSATAGAEESRIDIRSSLCFTLPAPVVQPLACYRVDADQWKVEVTWNVARGSNAQSFNVYRIAPNGQPTLVTAQPISAGSTGTIRFTDLIAPDSASSYRVEPLGRDGQPVSDAVDVGLGACAPSVDQGGTAGSALMILSLMASGMVLLTRVRRKSEDELA